MPKKHKVDLSLQEQARIRKLLSKGRELALVRKRAQALQSSHEGKTDEEVKNSSGLSTSAIACLRKRYVEEGIERALYCGNKGGRRSPYDQKDEAVLVALACSEAPLGRSCWTLELLAEKMSAEIGKPIKKSTVGNLLKKTGVNRGSRRCGVLEK
jgi:transposase